MNKQLLLLSFTFAGIAWAASEKPKLTKPTITHGPKSAVENKLDAFQFCLTDERRIEFLNDFFKFQKPELTGPELQVLCKILHELNAKNDPIVPKLVISQTWRAVLASFNEAMLKLFDAIDQAQPKVVATTSTTIVPFKHTGSHAFEMYTAPDRSVASVKRAIYNEFVTPVQEKDLNFLIMKRLLTMIGAFEAQQLGARTTKDDVISAIDAGSNVNVTDSRGNTPLHLISRNGSDEGIEIQQKLILAGGNVNAERIDGLRPIHTHTMAYTCNSYAFIANLLNAGADATKPFNVPKWFGKAEKSGWDYLYNPALGNDTRSLSLLEYAAMASLPDLIALFIAAGVPKPHNTSLISLAEQATFFHQATPLAQIKKCVENGIHTGDRMRGARLQQLAMQLAYLRAHLPQSQTDNSFYSLAQLIHEYLGIRFDPDPDRMLPKNNKLTHFGGNL